MEEFLKVLGLILIVGWFGTNLANIWGSGIAYLTDEYGIYLLIFGIIAFVASIIKGKLDNK